MHDLIEQFPFQLEDALKRFWDLDSSINNSSKKQWNNILCLGMWGSGIAGTLIQTIIHHEWSIPYNVCKDYTIPHWVNSMTLVISCSHSGTTEETVSAMRDCQNRWASIIIISSGGILQQIAYDSKIPLILLPDGMMPRACYTYAIVAQLSLLYHLHLLNNHLDEIQQSILTIHQQKEVLKKQAAELSWKLQWKIPVLYTDTLFEPIARRARQQLNENSKILCRHAVIPEMNHNEILGRSSQNNQIAPLFIRHTYEHTRNSYRIELTKEIIWPLVDEIIELQAIGSSLIEQMMTTIYILDRVSVYLADHRHVDPTEIPTITRLKTMLAKK